MQTDFLHLTLTKDEALALTAALSTRFVMEDEIRAQQGLEAVPLPPLLSRLAGLLGLREDALEKTMDGMADELWEYGWYVFTGEWAWYRAQQDALKALLAKGGQTTLESPECRRRAEVLYRKNFEAYIQEIDMRAGGVKGGVADKEAKRKNRRV